MAEQYVNLANSTLGGSIDGVTNPITFSVNSGDGALFPATTNGPFRVTICDPAGTNAEIMLVTTRATDTFTATRGAGATLEFPTPTLLAHANGSIVSHDITSGAMNQIRADSQQTGSGTLPSVSHAGDLWFPTDGVSVAISNGTTFSRWGPTFNLTPPPNISNYILQNGGSSTSSSGQDYLSLFTTGPTGQITGLAKAKLASTFTLTVGLLGMMTGAGADLFGIYVINTTNTSISTSTAITFSYQSPNTLREDLFVNAAFNSGPFVGGADFSYSSPCLFLRIKEDATHRTFFVSCDLQTWLQVFQQTVTTDLTTVAYGICTRNAVAGDPIHVDCIHWTETNP